VSDVAPTRHVGLRRQRYGVAPSSVNPKSLELFDRRSCWHPVVAQLHEKLDRGHRKFWIQVVFDRDPLWTNGFCPSGIQKRVRLDDLTSADAPPAGV